MNAFGTSQHRSSPRAEAAILAHFRRLDWLDFLADMYLCVEALGSDAVERSSRWPTRARKSPCASPAG
jgi:hypothetical protein